jgi:hypothetical protein
MLPQLQQKLIQPGKVSAVEITLLPEEKLLINGITVATRKNNIITSDKISGVQAIAQLPKQLSTANPLCVVFNGKGILVKKLTTEQTENPVSVLLPNANPADFYYELFPCGDFVVAAIARKELIEKYYSQLKAAGYRVLQVSLGFSVLQNILPFLNIENGKPIVTTSFILNAGGSKNISDFSLSENITTDKFQMTEYAIGDQYILSAHLLSFAAGVGLLTSDLKQSPAIDSAQLVYERTEFRFYKLFRAAGMFVLGFVFLVLLINFLIYNHYFSKNKELQATQSFSRSRLQEASALLENTHRKDLFLRKSGWTKPARISFYADRIASLTPSNTLLTTMTIHPVKTNTTGLTPVINFKTDTIQVAGTCDNPVEINQFINNLKIIQDFKEVSLKNYTYKKEQDAATFSIEIVTR